MTTQHDDAPTLDDLVQYARQAMKGRRAQQAPAATPSTPAPAPTPTPARDREYWRRIHESVNRAIGKALGRRLIDG